MRAWYARPQVKGKVLAKQREKYHTDPSVRARQVLRTKKRLRLKKDILSGRPCPDVCDICGKPETRRWLRLHYDHDHQHGHFRGWLCSRCNTVLGSVGDDPHLLLQMVAYLQRTKVNASPQFSLPGI